MIGITLIIPAKVNGIKVVEIGKIAFYQYRKLESVFIDARIRIIRRNAFCRCTNIRMTTIPNTCVQIDNGGLDFYDEIANKASEVCSIFFEPHSKLKTLDQYAITSKVTFNIYFCDKPLYSFPNSILTRVENFNIYSPTNISFCGNNTKYFTDSCLFNSKIKACKQCSCSSRISSLFLFTILIMSKSQ